MTQALQWPVARLRVMGSGLWILAGALAVFGSFLPLTQEDRIRVTPSETTELNLTLWGLTGSDGSNGADMFPQVGVAVVVSVVVLVISGLLGLFSRRLHPATGPVLAARLIGTGGTGLLIGSVVQPLLVFRIFDSQSILSGYGVTVSPGIGTWLLILGCVLSVAAIVLMLVPKIAKRGEEPETPPMGIPVVRVLEPEYDEPADQPAEAEQPTDPKG
ncbi:hypothetical protein LWC34_00225 [Kibdelosporangium philippinense]|uniref:DUF2975 domain-containing protein n=1 Tax=Kibdelosporangium philippinense TaxID=211113 RepID=A0ABS8YZW6_9PSEU|nr:hypothetical protein [Kibdelosporangium philippinense]MCE7001274.1 hypothetical protein [Kibdelosporangium philippinense]